MSKVTQDTFNEAVQENIELLGVSFDEALQETIKQFEAQKVDLSNIIKKSPIDKTDIINIIKKLEESINENSENDIIKCLNQLREQCDKGIEYKVVAGENGAYDQILNAIKSNNGNKTVEKDCAKTLIILMTKQPDLLDDKGIKLIIDYSDINVDGELTKLFLKWAKECCLFHEMNRQKLFNAGALNKLKILLLNKEEVLREVLAVFRTLILDDDIRVEFGKAHEHARGIASETLPNLVDLMKKHKNEETIINDLILTVSNLLVRNEFCKQFSDIGGLDLLREILKDNSQNEKTIQHCFKLFKALAGNDDCKAQIINKGIGPLIIAILNYNIKSVQISIKGLACVASLCLRSPENSKVLFENELPEILVQIMKTYPKEKSIQRTGSWAVRNMVSRSKYQCPKFLELGIEDILIEALKNFKEHEYDFKAALRDLGCDIELKEEWTGKGGLLTTGL